MTNREWLLNKIQNMSDGELCDLLRPCNFKEYAHVEYESKYGRCMCNWLDSEHKEPITISEAERTILENLPKNYKWIMRNKDGSIYIASGTKAPLKEDDMWKVYFPKENDKLTMFNHLFQFIKWENTEPHNIEELLKGE